MSGLTDFPLLSFFEFAADNSYQTLNRSVTAPHDPPTPPP